MVRIFSKKTFGLGDGARKDGTVDIFRTVVNGFQDVPDQYTKCKIFEMAVASGDITIIDDKSKQDEVARKAMAEKPAEVVIDEHKAFEDEVKAMNKQQVLAKAQEMGVFLTGNEKVAEIKRKVIAASQMEE